MASPAHDVLVQVLRDDPALLPEILSRLRGVALPPLAGAVDSSVRLARPVEVRPDVVFRTATGWVVCEVQNRIDPKKGRRWLLACSVLFDETRQMGDVVILTASAAVARWARRVGHVVGPAGTRLQVTPVVVYLSLRAVRALLDPKAPALGLCAAWAMHHRHGAAAARVVEDAINLTDHLPPSLRGAQLRAILAVLNQRMLSRLREAPMDPNHIPERPAVRKLREFLESVGEKRGLAEGKAESKQEDLLTVFSERGLPVTAGERARIRECTDIGRLSEWFRRAITAASVAEALAAAPSSKGAPPRDTPQSPPRPRRARPKAGARAAR